MQRPQWHLPILDNNRFNLSYPSFSLSIIERFSYPYLEPWGCRKLSFLWSRYQKIQPWLIEFIECKRLNKTRLSCLHVTATLIFSLSWSWSLIVLILWSWRWKMNKNLVFIKGRFIRRLRLNQIGFLPHLVSSTKSQNLYYGNAYQTVLKPFWLVVWILFSYHTANVYDIAFYMLNSIKFY